LLKVAQLESTRALAKMGKVKPTERRDQPTDRRIMLFLKVKGLLAYSKKAIPEEIAFDSLL